MAASGSSPRNAREFFELKQRAVQFYMENKVPEKLEEILNAMVYEHPPDVYGRLSQYFESVSKPVVISRIQAYPVLDSKGQQTLQADVYCIVGGIEKHMASSTMASFNHFSDSAALELKEEEDSERQKSVAAAIKYIQEPITERLSGLEPTNQKEVDEIVCSIIDKLREAKDASDQEKSHAKAEVEGGAGGKLGGLPKSETSKTDGKHPSPKTKKKTGSAKSASTVVYQEPREPMFCGCNAICAVSQAVAETASKVKGRPLYEHIASLCREEPSHQLSFPIPMVTAISSGKAAPGKQNLLREVLLLPDPGLPFRESLNKLTQVYHQISKIQFTKVGAAAYYTSDFGGVCPHYDRPEQLLDHVTEALHALGLTAGEDVFLGLNCAAHELYIPDKGKYEITCGSLKTGEEMVDIYTDIVTRYPGVVALIDPLKKHDTSAFTKLCDHLSKECLILGDQVYPRPEKFLLTGFEDLELNGAILKQQQMTSVTDLIKAANLIHDNDCVSVVAGVQGGPSDPFLADLAVGVQATFVKFGAPTRGERVSLYNRLGQISDELASRHALIARTEFPFREIHQPEPDDDASQQAKGEV